MERKRAWTDVVRTALRDAEADPPPGLWQRLERERGLEAGAAGFRRRGLWLRVGAAAAAVALCLLAGELGRQPGRGPGALDTWCGPEVGSGDVAAPPLVAAVVPEPNAEDGPFRFSGRSQQRQVAEDGASQPEKGTVSSDLSESRAAAEKTTTTGGTASGVSGAVRGGDTERGSSRAGAAQSRENGGELLAYEAPRAGRKTSFGLFGGGALAGGHSSPGVMTRSAMGMPVADENGVLTVDHRLRYESCSFRHRQPLSFGLTVRREFPYGLSLESGVVYTLLCSEATPAPGGATIDQRLHFVGVPLRMDWRFFERNRFSLYIGMGGMAEKCVAARLGGRTVREPGVQWSAAAAAGAQYRLGDVVGLYFEPDLSYYFTRTDLQTARTRSPLTFTLRLGVRFSF